MVTYTLMKLEHIASYQHVLLTKKSFPVPAFAYPVRKRLTDPYEEDTDTKELIVCADDTMDTRTTVPNRLRYGNNTNGMDRLPGVRTGAWISGQALLQYYPQLALDLDTGCWGDLSLDGKRYFVVAGLRVQREDKVMLFHFFTPVENKTGLMVSQGVFQLSDYIAACKLRGGGGGFHGSKVLRISIDQGAEFVNQDFEKHARQRGIHLAISPAHQPQSNGVAERLVGLAKQCTRRLLLVAGLPDSHWSYAMRFAAEMLRHKALGFQ